MPKKKGSSGKKKSLRMYQNLSQQAVEAYQHGRHRESADKYLEATLAAPDVWSENRYQIFHGYTSILREKYFAPSERDLEALEKQFFDNIEEPVLFRSEAGFTLAISKWDSGDRDAAATYYRETIALCDSATDEEKRRKTRFPIFDRSVADLIADNKKSCQENLAVLENPFGGRPSSARYTRSDGTHIPQMTRTTQTPLNDPLLMSRLAVGGKRCDCCHKTTEQLGRPTLDRCSRCGLAYYCSSECQKKAWKAGHKKACRKPDQIEKGDVMRVDNIQAQPELNGRLVHILGPDEGTEGRWRVQLHGEGRTISLASDKLEHIRPAK